MLIQSEASNSSSSPFPIGNRESAYPFEHFGGHESALDVLVIEDDIEMSGLICSELRSIRFNAVDVFSGEEGLAMLEYRSFALLLLDWRLPGCNGIEVLKTLRARDDRTPVFLMSALDAIEDRIFAFENGADDYLVKPFSVPELLARVRSRLRRAWSPENMQWRLGDLALNVETRRVRRAAQEIALTPREFDLLLYLVQHRKAIVTREMIGREVWRAPRHSPSLNNAIDVHIAHLRRKIDAERDVKLIHTVRGKGYTAFEAEQAKPVEHASFR